MSEDDQPTSLQARTRAWLNGVFVEGPTLIRELLEENDRLRAKVAQAMSGDSVSQPTTLWQLQQQIERLEGECQRIRQAMGAGAAQSRLESLERDHFRLAATYLVGRQFQTASGLNDVVRVLSEILINFIGIERFTIYCVDEERQTFFPVRREGGPIEDTSEVALPAEGALAEVLGHGAPWTRETPRGTNSSAILQLPLFSGTRLMGMVKIEGLFPQKSVLDDGDLSLLEIISESSGVSIESAWVRGHVTDLPPLSRRALEELLNP